MGNLYTICRYLGFSLAFFRKTAFLAVFTFLAVTAPSNLKAEFSDTGNLITHGTAENSTDIDDSNPTALQPSANVERKEYCVPVYFGWPWEIDHCLDNEEVKSPSGGGSWLFDGRYSEEEAHIDINLSNVAPQTLEDMDQRFVTYKVESYVGGRDHDWDPIEIKVVFFDENYRTLGSVSSGAHNYGDHDMETLDPMQGKAPIGTRIIRMIMRGKGYADNLSVKLFYDPVQCTNYYDRTDHPFISYNVQNSLVSLPLNDFPEVDGEPLTGNIHGTTEDVQTCILGESMPLRMWFPWRWWQPPLPADYDKYKFEVATDGILNITAGLPVGVSPDRHTKYKIKVKIKRAGHILRKTYYGHIWDRAKNEVVLSDIMLQSGDTVYLTAHGRSSRLQRRLDRYRVIFDFQAIETDDADDLCYDNTIYRGICNPFFNFLCTKITPIRRNQQTKEDNPLLTDVSVFKLTRSFMSFANTCGVKDKDNKTISYSCTKDRRFRFFFSTIFNKGYKFDLPDYNDVEEEYRPFTFQAFSFFNFGHRWYGSYKHEEVYHSGRLSRCIPLEGGGAIQRGPFDAWDTFRNISDRNISTKIAAKDFDLTIAQLSTAGDALDPNPIPANSVNYMLVNAESGQAIADTGRVYTGAAMESYNITKAYREVFVGFTICTDYNATSGGYTLSEGNVCNTNKIDDNIVYTDCFADTAGSPAWHVCTSTDSFSIRPKEFALGDISNAGTLTNPELLHSAQPYNFQIQANTDDDVPAFDYNQTGDLIDFNKSILLKDGTPDSANTLHGELYVSAEVLTFSDGVAQDSNITFSDIAKVDINITDRDWAIIDADDTPQSCEGGTINGHIIPDGTFICGEKRVEFIPDHFALLSTQLHNHRSGSFTYQSNDSDMQGHVTLDVSAMNIGGAVTQNFDSDSYRNDVNVTLGLPTQDKDGLAIPLAAVPTNIPQGPLNFQDGNYTISYANQELMFNYNRNIRNAKNPVDINSSDTNIVQKNVTVRVMSSYTRNDGDAGTIDSETIGGDENATGRATFLYANAKSAKDIYNDIKGTSVKTPIFIHIYCDFGIATCSNYGKNIGIPNWYLSINHSDVTDGKVMLRVTPNGGVTASADFVSGADNTVVTSSSLPYLTPATVDVDLDVGTKPWVIHNSAAPSARSPFHRMEIIGGTGWTGHGDTGNVVDTATTHKKNDRLSW